VTTAAPGGPGGGHNPDECAEILAEIKELLWRNKHEHGGGGTHGLTHRFTEQINGKSGPGTESWRKHDRSIKTQQRGLRKRLEKWDFKNCGDPPPNAWYWATRPAPKASEWQGQEGGITARDVGTGVLAAGALYATYRAVRLIPSLFPLGWPTLPANLAIP
jgi:hypothetical protein